MFLNFVINDCNVHSRRLESMEILSGQKQIKFKPFTYNLFINCNKIVHDVVHPGTVTTL